MIKCTGLLEKGKLKFSIAFIVPMLVFYAAFIIVPMIMTFVYSLLNWNGMNDPRYIGLGNFMELFDDANYMQTLLNTILLMLWQVVIKTPIAAVLAYFLYTTSRGFRTLRGIYFVPCIVSSATISLMFMFLFQSEGLFNYLLKILGMPALQQNWLSNPKTALGSVMVPIIWQFLGQNIIIFLAGMMAVPVEIIESAYIDGANSFKRFLKIILPNLAEVIQICIILNIASSFGAFVQPLIITNGGPGLTSSVIALYMYQTAFSSYRYGYGCTIALSIIFLLLVFTVLFKRIFSKFSV